MLCDYSSGGEQQAVKTAICLRIYGTALAKSITCCISRERLIYMKVAFMEVVHEGVSVGHRNSMAFILTVNEVQMSAAFRASASVEHRLQCLREVNSFAETVHATLSAFTVTK